MEIKELINLLRQDVVPALGCTEPVCIAFSAANVAKLNEGTIISLKVTVNPGIYKNGMSAGIPGCDEVGLIHAAALGVYLKNPEKKLQVLEDVTDKVVENANLLVENQGVIISVDHTQTSLYARCELTTEIGCSVCEIRDSHTNVVYLEHNGEVIIDKKSECNSNAENTVLDELKSMKLSEIRQLVDTAPV